MYSGEQDILLHRLLRLRRLHRYYVEQKWCSFYFFLIEVDSNWIKFEELGILGYISPVSEAQRATKPKSMGSTMSSQEDRDWGSSLDSNSHASRSKSPPSANFAIGDLDWGWGIDQFDWKEATETLWTVGSGGRLKMFLTWSVMRILLTKYTKLLTKYSSVSGFSNSFAPF